VLPTCKSPFTVIRCHCKTPCPCVICSCVHIGVDNKCEGASANTCFDQSGSYVAAVCWYKTRTSATQSSLRFTAFAPAFDICRGSWGHARLGLHCWTVQYIVRHEAGFVDIVTVASIASSPRPLLFAVCRRSLGHGVQKLLCCIGECGTGHALTQLDMVTVSSQEDIGLVQAVGGWNSLVGDSGKQVTTTFSVAFVEFVLYILSCLQEACCNVG